MNAEQFYSIYKECNKVTIDSRKIAEGDIFFAFSGENFNAATLAAQAVQQGAAAVVVEDENYADAKNNIYFVPSTLVFLQELAVYHRDRLAIPVIALTGSNGKTTTKELMHAVLSRKYNVQYTYGNLNNHIGVPLTLLSVKAEHELAVIEMGANHQKEIEFLCTLAKPDFGYITNFGKAHLEGFGGVEGVIAGKSELYTYLMESNGTVLINLQDALQKAKTEHYNKIITFGNTEADYFFEPFNENNRVGLEFNDKKIQSQLTGNYNFTNLCAAASLGLHFEVPLDEIATAIEEYTPTNMRSQVVQRGDQVLVLDTYNANPSSMAEALKNFATFPGTKTVIMGDMLELGEDSADEHAAVYALAEVLGFDKIYTVGEFFGKAGKSAKKYKTTDTLIRHLKKNKITSDNILLKGSRGIALERVVDYL